MTTEEPGQAFTAAEGAFFRPGPVASRSVRVPERPFDEAGADAAIREFFTGLAGSRALVERDDVEAFVIDNALLVLLGPADEVEFRSLFPAFPSSTAQRWDELLRGGVAAETFGARTDDEVEEEARIDADLKGGRRRRIVLFVALAVVVIVAGVVVNGLFRATTDDPELSLSDFFGDDDDTPVDDDGVLAPVPRSEFAVTLSTVVVVAPGDGPADERLVIDPPAEATPILADSVSAALFQFRGAGYVAIAGPTGFAQTHCVELAAVTPDLRALEVASHGSCAGLSEAEPGPVACLGDELVIIGLDVPDAAVELPEGGSAVASEVRVGVLSEVANYDLVEVRGSIGVLPDGDPVQVPRFSGPVGSEVSIEFPSGVTGRCTIEAAG